MNTKVFKPDKNMHKKKLFQLCLCNLLFENYEE